MDSLEFLKLNERLDSIDSMIAALQNMQRDARIDSKERSHDLNELMGALAKAQSEMKIAGKDSNNPYFKSKYADLASVVAASRPSLTKNGLSVMQQITLSSNGQRIIVTILGHSSGQFISSTMNINPAKEDVQSLGSAITYLRRYAYASIVGVVADDEDDDGEVAMKPVRISAPSKPADIPRYHDKISKDRLDILQHELKEFPDLAQSILNHYAITELAEISNDKFQAIYDRVVKIKREGSQ